MKFFRLTFHPSLRSLLIVTSLVVLAAVGTVSYVFVNRSDREPVGNYTASGQSAAPNGMGTSDLSVDSTEKKEEPGKSDGKTGRTHSGDKASRDERTTDSANGGVTTGGTAPRPSSPPSPSNPPGSDSPSTTARCTDPVYQTSDTNGMFFDGDYTLHNNMWNSTYGFGPETLYACSYHNWYVVSSQTNHDGAVLTYPNVHKDYHNWNTGKEPLISSFSTITSTFAHSSPRVGIYNVAYDIWVNGVASSGSTEIMIWTENFNQVPAGDNVATVSFGGRTYNVWRDDSGHYIAFVPKQSFTSGTLDLRAMMGWIIDRGWMPANSTLGQICYGVEIVSTGGRPSVFAFTDFSISDS